MTKYYLGGTVRKIDGLLYYLDSHGKYVYDFYRDYDDVRDDEECSEEEALKHYIEINGTDEGFYDI